MSISQNAPTKGQCLKSQFEAQNPKPMLEAIKIKLFFSEKGS